MEKIVRLCSFEELIEGSSRLFYVDKEEIVVFREGDKVFAFSNVCPHNHTRKMFKGFFNNSQITCPIHHYTYCAITGKPQGSAVGALKVYKVYLQDNYIFVKIGADPFNFKF